MPLDWQFEVISSCKLLTSIALNTYGYLVMI
jgi:hypothetical protein